jgi:hypothetical protein
MNSDFDIVTARRGTGCIKYDRKPELDPFWVADMDFASAPAILEALHKRVDHGIFGYAQPHEGLNEEITGYLKVRRGVEVEIGQAARKLAENEVSPFREPNTIEFAHSLESILGGICRSGMHIEDVTEPVHGKSDAEPGSMGHRSRFIAPYIRIKARKRIATLEQARPKLLIP